GIANELPKIALGDRSLVLVVNDDARLQRSAARIAVREKEVAVFRELFAKGNARPCSRLFCELHLFPPAHIGDLRHLRIQLLVSFAKLRDLPQAVLDTSNEVIPLRLCRPKR